MSKNQKTLFYWLLITLIVSLSFYFLSPITSYIFHSDIAIHVLMTYDFRCPDDLYYWGQDRLGSAVPAFGHLLYRCFHFTPVVCAALSEYFFLVIGFLSLSTLFKTKFSKLIFAIAWFLPLLAFQELIQLSQPYGEQACFLGLMVYFVNKSLEEKANNTKSFLFFSLGMISVFISIWISDLSWVAYMLLIPLLVLALIKKEKKRVFLFTGVFVLISVLGFGFIKYAKQAQTKEDDYSSRFFLSAQEILTLVGKKFGEVFQTFLFECGNILYSWHAIFFILGVVLFCYFVFILKENSGQKTTWRNYFLLYTVLCLLILFSSYWVVKNFSVNRYFTVVYVSVWITILISIENVTDKRRKILQVVFLIAALFSAASSIVPHYIEGRSDEKLSRLDGFKKLGKIGVIGNYWRSYYVAAADPENIVATVCEGEHLRCTSCTDSVFLRPTIYLIQDGWLDSLPSQIWQHGRELVRTGDTQNIGGLITAPYEVKTRQQ